MTAKYPGQSPYLTFNDNPIYFADPNGLEGEGDGGKSARDVLKKNKTSTNNSVTVNKGTHSTSTGVGTTTPSSSATSALDPGVATGNTGSNRVAEVGDVVDIALTQDQKWEQMKSKTFMATPHYEYDENGNVDWLLYASQSSYEARREFASGGTMMYNFSAVSVPGVATVATTVEIEAVEVGMQFAAKTSTNTAKLSTAGVKLTQQLASDAQIAEEGVTILKVLKIAPQLVERYGGNVTDWVKKSSSSFTKNGKTFETHWYENISNGQKVEFKTKLILGW